MYAIVEIAGKQYKVAENDNLIVPRLNAGVDESITLDRVLLIADGDDVQIGTPTIDNAAITATVVEHVRGDKILVFRKKRRKRFKVKKGHRQPYTRIEIKELSAGGKKSASKSTKKKKAPKAAETEPVDAAENEASAASE